VTMVSGMAVFRYGCDWGDIAAILARIAAEERLYLAGHQAGVGALYSHPNRPNRK
jgi:hypothetical protein